MTMADLRTRFADADRLDAPELWDAIQQRVDDEGTARVVALPAERRPHQLARKVVAVAAAIVVTVALVSLLIRAFRREPVPVGPGPNIFGRVHGMITYHGPKPTGRKTAPDLSSYQALATDPISGRTTPVFPSEVAGAPVAWSPDGDTLILSDGSVLRSDGSKTRLPGVDPKSMLPLRASFAPDGKHVAYASNGGGGIRVVDISGTTPPLVILEKGDGPSWSPDGSVIAFATQSNRRGWLVETIRPDGTGRHTILRMKPLGLDDPDALAWSPDGSHIAFSASHGCCQDSYYRIVVVDADGTNATMVTPQNGSAFPAWSPDGSRIVFARGPQFFTMKPDGSDVKTVPGQRAYDTQYGLIWNHGG